MGLLEAAKRGVSQSTELAGTRPNWRKTKTAQEEEAGEDETTLLFTHPGPSLPPHSGPGNRLWATQKTPSPE